MQKWQWGRKPDPFSAASREGAITRSPWIYYYESTYGERLEEKQLKRSLPRDRWRATAGLDMVYVPDYL